MIIQDQENYIEFSLVEVDGPPAGCGDGHFHVKVSAHGFSGENFVWIEAFEFHTFVDELKVLAEQGEGAVRLESLAPHELKIVIRVLKKTGDIAIEGELRRNVYIHSRRRRVENRLVFVLDLDKVKLLSAVARFREVQRHFPLP